MFIIIMLWIYSPIDCQSIIVIRHDLSWSRLWHLVTPVHEITGNIMICVLAHFIRVDNNNKKLKTAEVLEFFFYYYVLILCNIKF